MVEDLLNRKISLVTPEIIFRFFKYAVYALLAYNTFLFFQEDLTASAQTFGDTVTWRNVVEAYSASIDTGAWLLLLLLFELRTAVIPDHLLKGPLKWVLNTLAACCYFFYCLFVLRVLCQICSHYRSDTFSANRYLFTHRHRCYLGSISG